MTADSVTLNAGTGGDTIATDLVGGVEYQRVKLVDGTIDGTAPVATGDGTNTNAMRVTVATDSSALSVDDGGGTLSVDDGGGTLSVDGTVTAAQATAANLNMTEANSAAILADTANMDTNLGTLAGAVSGTEMQVDIVGALPAGSATIGAVNGVYSEDVATPATIVGHAVMMERDDALSALTPVEGDWVGLRCDSQGALWVDVVNAEGTITDDSAFTPGSDTVAVMGGVADETATDTVDEGDAGAVRMTTRRALYTTFETPAGDSPWDDTNDALQVNVVAGSAGGTEYTEDAAAAANPAGGAQILVRQDTPATLVSTDGDNVARRGTNYGAAYTQIVDSSGNFVDSFGGSGGTAMVDDAAFAVGTTQITPAGAMFDDTAPDSVDEGDGGVLRMSANRNLYSTIRDAAGNERGVNVTAGNALTVDGSATTQPVSGTVTANLSATDNAVLDQIEVNTSYGDNTGNGTAAGALRVTVATDTTGVLSVDDNGGSLTIDGTVTANAGTGTMTVDLGANNDVQGAGAHDAAVTGNPFLLAGEARTSLPTAVANGDAVRLQADDDGRLVTQPMAPRDMINDSGTRVALTSTTRTELVAAGGAGVFNDLVGLVMSNESATEVRVDIFDLSAAGQTVFSVDLAADGGGAVIMLPIPWPQGTANNAWDVQLSAAVSTVYVSAICVERQ